jgi:hypothetical protein
MEICTDISINEKLKTGKKRLRNGAGWRMYIMERKV